MCLVGGCFSVPYLIRVDAPWVAPQYKRIAAIQGDIVFHGPRRLFLKYLADKQNSWAFSMFNLAQLGLSATESPAVHKRGKNTPFIGAVGFTTSFLGYDLQYTFLPLGPRDRSPELFWRTGADGLYHLLHTKSGSERQPRDQLAKV